MLSDRIKKLAARISAMQGPEGGVYVVEVLDGVYTCDGMTWTGEEEFIKWQNTLPGDNLFIMEDF